MNRLKKELKKRNIIKHVNDNGLDLIELNTFLIGIDNGFIIIGSTCNVIDDTISLYDLHFNLIARQNIIPDYNCMSFESCFDPWDVYIY